MLGTELWHVPSWMLSSHMPLDSVTASLYRSAFAVNTRTEQNSKAAMWGSGCQGRWILAVSKMEMSVCCNLVIRQRGYWCFVSVGDGPNEVL